MTNCESLYSMLQYNMRQIKTHNELETEFTCNNINYNFEIIQTDIVNENILNNVSNNENKFLLLIADSIDLPTNVVLTPLYPKKSLIIVCKEIKGSGTISMTGKGPNVLPEDIKLFDETDPVHENVIIPAYANNAVNIWTNGDIGSTNSYIAKRRGINGTGFNCGSGGCGGIASTNWENNRISVTMQSGSGYSYGGGAGTGACTGGGTTTIKVNETYPMRGADGVALSYYTAIGGIGNPNGNNSNGSYPSSTLPEKIGKGVGGRLIIFCKTIENVNLESKGDYYKDSYDNNWKGIGGSSGGGSINIFYSELCTDIITNVSSQDAIFTPDISSSKVKTGAAGGNGTVTKISYEDTLFFTKINKFWNRENSNIYKDPYPDAAFDFKLLFKEDDLIITQ